jgi:hypothetical protein
VASTDPAPVSQEERAHELIPAYWIRNPKPFATAAGMHRFVWDLHYTPPRSAKHGFPISAVPGDTPPEPQGPLAVPGLYRVQLRIGNKQWEQPLSVIADPRVKTSEQDFAQQLALAQGLAGALDASTQELLKARSLRTQLKARAGVPGAIAAQLKELNEKLESLIESKPGDATWRGLEKVNGDIGNLYGQVMSADTAPTKAQTSAAEALFKDWQSVAASSVLIWQQDVAALNRELTNAHLPPLRNELAAHDPGDDVDEE